jgi:glycosyltransferase involved in cell wall biosynthesis
MPETIQFAAPAMPEPHRSPPAQAGASVVYLWDADYPWDVRAQKVCASLSDAGYDVHIVARNRAWRPTTEHVGEGTIHRMRPWRVLGRRLDGVLGFPAFVNPRWAATLARTVLRVRPSVIIARDLPLCPVALAVGRALGIPVIFDMAENYPAMIRDMWLAGGRGPADYLVRNPVAAAMVERACVALADRIVVVVEESAERLHELGVGPERVRVVSNTPPRARIAPGPRAETGGVDGAPIRLVYLGLMELPRGIATLLMATSMLVESGVRVRLELIGEGRDLASFRGLAADLKLAASEVSFLGHVPHGEALAHVASADIGVIPHLATESWNTTVPNKLFDYMAAGLAVISSDALPCARIVRQSGAGLVFRDDNPAALAEAIRRLADPAVRRGFGEAGRAAVAARYHWERDAGVLIECVGDLVRRGLGHPVPARAV